MKYIVTKDTAKIIRKALKESFPGAKFSVRSSVYSGGSSIDVSWKDGPCVALVEAITELFNGSYFDGMTDYKGNRTHLFNGERVSWGADFVFCHREVSDTIVEKAINSVYMKYKNNLDANGVGKPTIEDYRKGRYYSTDIFDGENKGNPMSKWSLQNLIATNAGKRSTFVVPEQSDTVDSICFVGDDGYGYNARGKVNHLKSVN